VAIFDNPTGSKYRLPFPGGSIVSTDFFFNHYFSDAAFKSTVEKGVEVDVAASSYSRSLWPGGPSKSVSRKAFKYRRYSLGVGTRNAVGTECWAKDGKDQWKFSLSGNISKFMAWLDTGGKTKRVFQFKTAHGTPYTET